MKLGVMGGTFDPVHRGHLAVAGAAKDSLGLDRVLLIPAGQPLLKSPYPVTPASQRLEMLRLALAGKPGYEVSDVDVDLAYQNSALDMPRFVLSAYDGNLGGHARLDLGTGDPEGVAYQVKAQLAGINSARLPRVRRGGEAGSELCANMEFAGKGIDPRRRFDVEGSLHITKIERRVAENLLMLMDPKETDKSIQNMRRLMRRGWGMKSFSFATKHGFVYPSIVPVKPWYAPFSLPKSLDFPRMPLKFFLEYLGLS